MARITELYDKVKSKKTKYKKEYRDCFNKFQVEKERLEKDIQYLREKVFKTLLFISQN